jgi:hypothetical protein
MDYPYAENLDELLKNLSDHFKRAVTIDDIEKIEVVDTPSPCCHRIRIWVFDGAPVDLTMPRLRADDDGS